MRFIIGLILTIFSMIGLLMLGLIFWPLPDLLTPKKQGSFILKTVNIINIKTGSIRRNHDIQIENGIITKIDSNIENSSINRTIDGNCNYVIPGLWNMHSHSTQFSPWLHHPLQVAYGITGLRDMSGSLDEHDDYWAGTKDRILWNKEVTHGQRVAPKYVLHSSYQMNGPDGIPSSFPSFFRLDNENQVSDLINFYEREGTDFIKVYSELDPKVYRRLASELNYSSLHLAGHKVLSVSLEESILLGQRSFEHGRIFMFDCFPNAHKLLNSENKIIAFRDLKPEMVREFNMDQAKKLMRLMLTNESYWVPTMQTLKIDTSNNYSLIKQDRELEYVNPMRKQLWWGTLLGREKHKTNEEVETSKQFYLKVKEQLNEANRIGVPIMLGTDVTDTNIIPGISVHRELAELVASGLSNLEAIQTATINAARFSNKDDQYGNIDKGFMADIVILSENPLEDIKNTNKIEGVVLNGSYYNKRDIDELKKFVKSNAQSVHFSIKILSSIFTSPLMRAQIAD